MKKHLIRLIALIIILSLIILLTDLINLQQEHQRIKMLSESLKLNSSNEEIEDEDLPKNEIQIETYSQSESNFNENQISNSVKSFSVEVTPTAVPTPAPKYSFTKKEIEMLERITEAEATGRSKKDKAGVASVVINRISSEEFPNNMVEVIFQHTGGYYQFSPIEDGRYWDVKITKETKSVIAKILKDGVINKALYFCNPADVKSLKNKRWFASLTLLYKDDSHSFYK
jgi:N-acetylmuramoyl-L-alanine amidase